MAGRDNHTFGDQAGLLSAKLRRLELLQAEFACCHFEMAAEKKRNPQFPIRFKEDFGGEEDIRPAAKEDVDEFTGTSRVPRGRILLVFGENFSILSARLPTPTPQPEGFQSLTGSLNQVPFRSTVFSTTRVNIPALACRAGALTMDLRHCWRNEASC